MFFWPSIIILTFIVAFICFYPLWRNRVSRAETQRDALNKAFYFNRLQELEQEAQQGLSDDVNQFKTELQQTLLDDIPETRTVSTPTAKPYGKIWALSGFVALLILAGSAYMPIGAWKTEIALQKNLENLPHFYQRLKEEQTNPLNDQELQQFITALRLKLQNDPQDAEGWWLLGQSAMAADNGQLAADSYARAHRLAPENTEYQLAYARILMYSEDQSDKQKGTELLKEVLRKDHTNMHALNLLAFRYFETEDYKMASVTWAMILRLMPENDPRVPLIEKSIRAARDALEEQQNKQN
ncbi:c-type cytochrome biogenesis protein CcmI [Caviibacterium pharyngocola]|uniref:C-type cytochrome biogenesis protein CcmI n=1 Tax=Caviibacterium pharyngocola TaxID=28159 RepID=A0A2M8RVG2_9PAST|nr:c-type cytochrome biogenesis protein CcmI [Caviibacterium pharyngocola]PJG82882.1 c-type cytochrome biogenesis protein CcmI [Caviibacterium pharyngocola]